MRATATITAIRSTHSSQLITHEMLASCTTMAASAKYPDLVNEIAFFQVLFFAAKCKYTVS